MPRALVCLCSGCLESRQSLSSTLRAPELGRVMSGAVSVALFRTWSVGGVAPGHTRADKLRRSSRSQALCKSTSTHRGRHTGFCVGEHRQCVPATTARHRRSSQNLLSTHCSWLVLVRLQPLRSDIGSLPLLNIFFFCLPDRLCRILQITDLSSPFLQENKPL